VSVARPPGLRAARAPIVLVALAGCTSPPGDVDPGAATAAAMGRARAPMVVPPIERPSARRDASSSAELQVTHARGRVVPRGRFDVHVWGGAANTGTLLDRAGLGAVPVSEARFLWSEEALYLFFYAGDLDLQAHTTKHDGPVWNDDSVTLAFPVTDGTERVIQISVTGTVADGVCPGDAASLADPRCDLGWESGVRVGTDADGTLNHVGDRDEEWAVEAAIPLTSIGVSAATAGTHIPLWIGRCEIAHEGPRACGAWGSLPARGILVLRGR
jgi:hypothetical protein